MKHIHAHHQSQPLYMNFFEFGVRRSRAMPAPDAVIICTSGVQQTRLQ